MAKDKALAKAKPEEKSMVLVDVDAIGTDLRRAGITAEKISELTQYLGLDYGDVANPDPDVLARMKEGKSLCVKLRTTTVKVCKAGREDAVKIQKLWIEREKETVGEIGAVENVLDKHLRAIEEHAAEVERQRQAEVARLEEEARKAAFAKAEERAMKLTKLGVVMPFSAIQALSDSEWEEVHDQAIELAETKRQEDERLKAEREKADADAAELEAFRREKREKEEREAAKQNGTESVREQLARDGVAVVDANTEVIDPLGVKGMENEALRTANASREEALLGFSELASRLKQNDQVDSRLPVRFVPDEEANTYVLMDAKDRWVGTIKMNPEMSVAHQQALIDVWMYRGGA